MPAIYTSANFTVFAPETPLVDREDGGHIVIEPKIPVSTRQELNASLSIELMRLISITGEAMTTVMTKKGIEIGRVNYQDNGNWSVFKPGGPKLHYHIYGRAVHAKIQRLFPNFQAILFIQWFQAFIKARIFIFMREIKRLPIAVPSIN